jgi:hypothetical protein
MQCAINTGIYWKNFRQEEKFLAEMVGCRLGKYNGDEWGFRLIRSRQDGDVAVFATSPSEYWTARRISSDWQTSPADEPTAKWGDKPQGDLTIYRDASSGAAIAYRWYVRRLDAEALAKHRRRLEDAMRKDQHTLVSILAKTGLI